jgi:hypothetical protein
MVSWCARVVLALVIAQGTECGERDGNGYSGGRGMEAAGSALPAFVPASVTIFRQPIFHRAVPRLRAREEEARSEAAGGEAAAKIVPAQRDGDAAPEGEMRAPDSVNCVGTCLYLSVVFLCSCA